MRLVKLVLPIFLLTLAGGRLSAVTVNMSHDLVTLGIAGQNLTPNNPSLDARPLFQAAIQYVQSHSVQTLTLDQGNYYLLSATQGNAVLILPGLHDLVIDLAGSTLYFNTPLLSTGINIYECTNLTFTNFQTDYITPPYTHLAITSVDPVNRTIQFQTLPGWPSPSTFNGLVDPYGGSVEYWGALFRSGQIIPGTSRTRLTPPFNGSTLALTQDFTPWTQSATLATLQAGDTLVVTARAGGGPIGLWRCDGITLSNVSIYGSNGFAVTVYETSNSVMDHVKVMPRPGGGLVGSNADGIHFISAYQNNHIRNCYVTRTMDDGLILDTGLQATVVSTAGARQVTVTRMAFNRFANGTAMNFVDPLSTLETTGGVIVSQSPPDSESPGFGEQITLIFDRDLPALAPGYFLVYGSAGLRGQGSTIEDSTVEDVIIGKGIWLNGVMGVTAQRNVIRRTSESGISVSQDTLAFPAPPVHNLTLTDNAVEHVPGPMAPGTGMQTSMAGIQVVTTNNQQFGFSSSAANSDVTIHNNYIADSAYSGIWVGETNNGTLQNNLIIRSNQSSNKWSYFGIPPVFHTLFDQDIIVPVAMRFDTNVVETGDTILATSPVTAPVTFSPASVTTSALAANLTAPMQTAVTGFGWKAASDASWLTVDANFIGSGNGSVAYGVLANNSGTPRTGHITVAGEIFTVNQSTLSSATLSVTVTHTGNLRQGFQGGLYTIRVSNGLGAPPTSGTVTATVSVPAGLTFASLGGSGWNCTANSCTRSDALDAGQLYPPLTLKVNVDADAAASVTMQATASGGGSAAASANDPTTVAGLHSCDLNVDNETNVADVQIVINEALGVRLPVSDLNQDGVVNIVDIQRIINAALGLPCAA